MGNIKKAFMENTEDDMGVESGLSSHGKLIAGLMENQKMELKDAWIIGWSLHEIDSSIDRLNLFADADLSKVKDELDLIMAKLTKVAEKAQK